MVGYDKNEKKLKEWQYMFAGGASGALTRCTSQPLDVVKIRFQLQVEPIAQGSKYTSLIQATRTILKEEGLIALWSGHIPAQYLSISYGIAQFWCYELLTEKCHKVEPNIPQTFKPMINFTCGAVAGSFATTVSFPFDTIRTRLIAEEKNARVYKGIWHMCQHMVVNEGKLSLFKGLFPTIAQIAPHAGAQFMFYKLVSEYLKPPENLKSNDSSKKPIALSVSLYSGSIAGVLSKLLIYPFDLAKKRMQIQGFQHNRLNFGKQFVCTGFFHCISHTIKCEGFTALYKGLYPSLLKAMLVSALHFTFFEQICNAFRSFDEEL